MSWYICPCKLPLFITFSPGLLDDDEKSLEEKLALFEEETFNIKSEFNKKRQDSFQSAIYQELSQLMAKRIPGFKWMAKLFSLQHTAPNTNTSTTTNTTTSSSNTTTNNNSTTNNNNTKTNNNTTTNNYQSSATQVHVETPFFLNEQSTLNMRKILKKMVNRYLNLLSDMVEDKDTFDEMVKVARDKTSSIDSRNEAEEHIKKESRKHGELVIHGDQLTLARIESARRLSKGSITMLGRLELVKVIVTGMFHADMNRVIYDYQVRRETYQKGCTKFVIRKILAILSQTGKY